MLSPVFASARSGNLTDPLQEGKPMASLQVIENNRLIFIPEKVDLDQAFE